MPVRQHEVGHDLGVVDVWQQVEGRLHTQGRQELGELDGRFCGNYDVIGPVDQADWWNSGRVKRQRFYLKVKMLRVEGRTSQFWTIVMVAFKKCMS